jgi:hypothetical protein
MALVGFQSTNIGVHNYSPEGPFAPGSQFPQATHKPGSVVNSDNGAEFIYLLLNIVSQYTATSITGTTPCMPGQG